MKRILETEAETRQAVTRFRRRITEIGGQPQSLEWGFPNGERASYPTFALNSTRGPLQIGMPTSSSKRVSHLLRFVRTSGPPSPDVEINIPNALNRSVSGAYVLTDNSTWLCTRGAFTAFRGQIPRETSFQYFRKWLISVQDGERQAQVIPVAALDSESLADDLAEFIQSVLDLKEAHKNGTTASEETLPAWHLGEEFEGLKKPTARGASGEYEYTHGPLCNGLSRCLSVLLKTRSDLQVRKNVNIDVAVILKRSGRAGIIFEVKTSAAFNSQIYSAIGQLLVYKQLYGCDECTLALVLPKQCAKDARDLTLFLTPQGIHILIGDGSTFQTLPGKSLEAFVEGCSLGA